MLSGARLRASGWERRGRSEPFLPSGSSQSARDRQGSHQAAVTTAGCEAPSGDRGEEASSRALGTESGGQVPGSTRAPGTQSAGTQSGVWVSSTPRPRSAPATADCPRGCLSQRLRAPNSGFPQFLGPGSELQVPPHAARPDGQFSLSQSQDVWAVRLAARNQPPGRHRPAQARPLQRWSPRHSPGRAVEQREAGAGVRGCRHLASPPPIWRALSTLGNWKTQKGRGGFPAACASARAHIHPRTHGRTDAQSVVVAVETGILFRGVLQGLSWLSLEAGASLGRQFSEGNGLVGRGSVSLYILFSNTLPGSKVLWFQPHRQPFYSQDGEKLEGIGLRDWKNTTLLFLL